MKLTYDSAAVVSTHSCTQVSKLEHIFLRGSKIRFLIIPDMLKNAPMFKRIDPKLKKSAMGVGRGRAIAMRAKARAQGKK